MNRKNLRRFAPFGLYLAGLAAIATIGLFIVQRSFTLPIQISLGAIVLGLAAFILFDPGSLREALTGRQARYGSNALLMAVAFIGIVVVINYLVYTNSRQWDLTEDQTNSLTTETLQTLESLTSPVQADAYYTVDSNSNYARTLLQLYKNNSKGKFDFQIVDPITNQIQAEQDKITRNGTIVLKMDGRQEQVTYASEEELTSGLVRLANPGDRVVYFLQGHGEYEIESTSENNYYDVRSALEAKNYTVNTLNLLAAPKIPDNALAIIVAGPTKPLSQQEVDLIKTYQQNGGSLVYLADPRAQTQFGEDADPMQVYLQEIWGIEMGENVVIEPASQQAVIAISQGYGDHAITRKMNNLSIVLPFARSVAAIQGQVSTDIQLTDLAYTSEMAWGETDIASIENNAVTPDAGKDLIGPISFSVAGENTTTQSRVLVVGDSDFAGNNGYRQLGNSSFILNGIDWAAEQDNLISLNPNQPTQRFIVPQSTAALGLILIGSVLLPSALVIFLGVTTWLQRRRKG